MINIVCETCGKTKSISMGRNKAKYCSVECANEGFKKTSFEEDEKICNLYENKKLTLTEIQKELKYKISRQTILNILKRKNIKTRTVSDCEMRRLIPNDSYFSGELTEEKAYWIGFFMADGNVHEREGRRNIVGILLGKKDEKHLEKLKKCLGVKNKTVNRVRNGNKNNKFGKRNKKYSSVGVQFTSEKIFRDLEKYGVVPRKSKKERAFLNIDNNRDFWRGVVDGDGSLGLYKYNDRKRKVEKITLSGSVFLLTQFLDFINKNITKTKQNPHYTDNCYSVSFSYKIALKIIKYLYDGSTVYLDRKKEIADKIIYYNETKR